LVHGNWEGGRGSLKSPVMSAARQRILNAAARLVARKRKSDTLRDVLHWLPIRQRFAYKLSVLMFNCLNSVAPSYRITMCQPVSEDPGRRYLRLTVRRYLVVPATRTVRFGPRSFAAAGPSTWNTLPVGLRNQQLSAVSFHHHLKTVLFRRAYNISSAHS